MPEGKPTHTGATEQSAMLADLSTTPTRRHTVPTSAWILLFLSTLTNRLKSASPYVNPQPCCGRGADCKLPPIRPQNRLGLLCQSRELIISPFRSVKPRPGMHRLGTSSRLSLPLVLPWHNLSRGQLVIDFCWWAYKDSVATPTIRRVLG